MILVIHLDFGIHEEKRKIIKVMRIAILKNLEKQKKKKMTTINPRCSTKEKKIIRYDFFMIGY